MTSQGIRDVVAAGDYVRAARLFDEYARELPAGEAALAELADLLEWTRVTVLCAQAHAEDNLQQARRDLVAHQAYTR